VNLLNPELVIVGGSLAAVLELAGAEIACQLDRHAMPAARRGLRLCVPGLGRDSSLLGAAELAFESLLHDPMQTCAARQRG
jgi:predicted NBD/HSP70 family sugar kinase